MENKNTTREGWTNEDDIAPTAIVDKQMLLASFMGLHLNGDYYHHNAFSMIAMPMLGHSKTPFDLKFNVSWDWLVPVLDKIIKIDSNTLEVNSDEWYAYGAIDNMMYGFNLDMMFNLAYEFIKAYNERKQR